MIKNMELNFIKKENGWVAEFEASADFNLHIDGVLEGNVQVYQRGTTSGGYALVRGATPYPTYGKAYDSDFSALVYPKFIKVVCATEPSYAVVTFASSGGSGGGEASGDDVLFFDGQILYNAFGYDLATMFGMILGNSSFINKTTYYMENYAGRLPWSEGSFLNGGDPDSLRYVCVSNSLTPTVVMMGSGAQEIPKQEKPIGFFEFLEILTSMGMTVPIDVFKEAEVSREVVEQWMQE